ncbi:MAG: hypothetical protein HN383_18255 [Verrucomicrobia bacterium]|jgi:hypothetical protein|nr:hypothetical protein [Verrucomicrobiota bacterium]
MSAAEHLPDMARYRRPLTAEIQIPALGETVPTNLYGNAVQLAYPELGVARIGDDPALFAELVAMLRSMNVRLLRFPGGTWCHAYSIHGPKTMDALRTVRKDYILDRSKYQWTDTRVYLKLCKAVGADALFQLNMAHWVDPTTMAAYRIAKQDSSYGTAEAKTALRVAARELEYAPEKTVLAVADAQQVAEWAKELGVRVLWEFGNEDYTLLSPETYLGQCQAFYQAIKAVDAKAAFVITADGYSWSDWRWGKAVIDGMADAGLKDIAHLSCHVYMTGGCRLKPTTGESAFRGFIGSWYELRFLHHGLRKQLKELGRNDIKIAITEGNMVGPGTPIIGKPHEHGMGRALAEAAIFPKRIRSYSMLVHHDLVRSDHATWFCRIFYSPDQKPGRRYSLPTDGAVMQIAGEHAMNQAVYADVYEILALSMGKDQLLLTIGNPVSTPRSAEIALRGLREPLRILESQGIVAADLDSPNYTTQPVPCKIDGQVLRLLLPPFSYVSIRLAATHAANE